MPVKRLKRQELKSKRPRQNMRKKYGNGSTMTFRRVNQVFNNTFRRKFHWGQNVMLSSNPQFFSHWASLRNAVATGNPGEYTMIFDQYRIMTFQVKWIPNVVTNVYVGSDSGKKGFVMSPSPVYAAYDFDGVDVTLMTFNAMQELASFTTFNPSKPSQLRIVPRILTWVQTETGTGGNFGLGLPWLDAASPDVKHYGFIWCIGPGATPGTDVVNQVIGRFDLSVMIEFRGPR